MYIPYIVAQNFDDLGKLHTAYSVVFEGHIFHERQVCKDFCGLIFADHQVEYIVSLSHCFFLRIKISHSASSQRNP